MGSKRLKFSVDSFQSMSLKIEELAGELSELDTKLQSQMEQLKKNWQTPAGKEFFEKQDTSWTEEIQKYISTLETLQEMVDYAADQYNDVEIAANKLSVGS